MSEINVSPQKLFIVKAREFGRLLVFFTGGSILALGAANSGTAVGAILATAFGLLTTAGVYFGQRLAIWRIWRELSRPLSKAATGCDCHQ
jgi:hypothetical protein